MKKLTRTALSSVFMLGLIVCGTSIASAAGRGDRVDEQFSISDSTRISLDITNADVIIGVSSDNNVHITYYNTNWHTYEIKQSDYQLVIQQIVPKDSSNWKSTDFLVLIPAQFSGDIGINSHFGHIKAEEVSMKGDISIRTIEGNINLSAFSANSIAIRANGIKAEGVSTKGDISMYANSWSINLSDVKSTDGKLTVDANSMGIKAEEISAKGDISISANSMGINLNDIVSTDGKLTVDANSMGIKAEEIFAKGDISIGANSRGINLNNVTSTAGKLTVGANSGNIKAEGISSKGDILVSANSRGITLSDVTSTNGKLTVEANSWNIDLNTASADSIALIANGGNIKAEGISSKGELAISLISDSADIKLNGAKATDVIIKTKSVDKISTSVSASGIDFNANSGQVKFEQIVCTNINIENFYEKEHTSRSSVDVTAQNITIYSTSDFSVHTKSDSDDLPREWEGSGRKMLDISNYLDNIDIRFTK